MMPAVSCASEIGTIRSRLNKPIVGFKATTLFCPAGNINDPAVSVPIVTVAKFNVAATEEPELEPPTSYLP